MFKYARREMDETAKDSTQSEVYGFPLRPAASLVESFDGT